MKRVSFFRSIQLKFIIIYILLLLVAVQIIGSYFSRELETELMDTFIGSVNDRVELLNFNLEEAFDKDRSEDADDPTLQEDVQKLVTSINTDVITSLQVINSQGRVIGTNSYLDNRNIIGKKVTEPIVQKALLFGSAEEEILLDSKTGNRFYIKAEPIYIDEDNILGVIHFRASLEGVYDQLQNINKIFLRGSILAITVSAILGVLVARAITKPIIEMRRQAQTMAKGDFSQKVNVYGTDEISHLAETFNDLNVKLRHSIASTEKEQRKLSSVLSHMSDGVIATDETGKITLINKAAGRLIGQNPESLKGKFLPDVVPLEDRLSNVLEIQNTDSIIIDLSEHNNFLVRATFSTILDERDKITGFITVISDVTEQEKVERERREFVSNVSHELRTPLTTIRSYLEALTDGAWKDKDIAPKFLSVAQDETERMIRLVNDLLNLSRMDNIEHSLHKEQINFISYFHHVIDRFEMNVTEDITIERNVPKSGTYYVWLDEDKMTQVLDNIISNAIKYSPEGGTISCKVERLGYQLLISIKDEGLGIPYDRLNKVFDRFYRVDQARTRKLGGSGLGLAITKELVEAHYGTIWAESVEGKGTTILFTLPLMKERRGYS